MTGRPAITYHQLQTFLAVARTGNLTTVARELNATQPTVSLQLHSLRKALGTPLFERPGGRFRLTPAGEKLRRYAEEALDGLRTLQQEIAVLKGSPTGSLAVGVTFFVISRVLPDPSRFRAQFPGVDIQVQVDLPEPLFNRLLTNTLDVVCYLKVRTPPEFTVETLGEEEFAIIISPQNRLAGRRRVSVADLSEESLVVSSTAPYRELVEAKVRAASVVPRVVTAARNSDAVNALVDRNMGYTMHLKSLVAADIAAGRFAQLRLEGPPLLGEIAVAFRPRRDVPPLIQEFIRFARAELKRSLNGQAPATSTRVTDDDRPARARRRPRRRC